MHHISSATIITCFVIPISFSHDVNVHRQHNTKLNTAVALVNILRLLFLIVKYSGLQELHRKCTSTVSQWVVIDSMESHSAGLFLS